MLVSCPSCQAELDVSSEYYNQMIECPNCSAQFPVSPVEEPKGVLKEEPTAAAIPDKMKAERSGWEEKDHANVDFLKSFGLGLGITVLFLGLMIPFKQTTVGSIFLERGWVNYAETFLFFWGLVILGFKVLKNRGQQRASVLDLSPSHIGREIHSRNVGDFIDNLYGIPEALRDTLIVNRTRKSLELFELRNDNTEIAAFLDTQSDLDANRSASSYSYLKVFLWAIPILGFVGTVMGLSAAVGALDMGDASGDPEALQSAIKNLTGGLGTAFDTTLLGLILSLILNFPLAAVQKKEEEILTIIDTVCTERLLPKLNDSKASSNNEILEQADSLPELVGSLARAHETFLVNLNETTQQLQRTSEILESNLVQASERLSQVSGEMYLKSNKELDRTLQAVSDGVDSFNRTLTKLAENGVLEREPKKKGLFGK